MDSPDTALTLDPATSAFLIIDMQNDFLDSGGHFARQGLSVAKLACEPSRRF